MSADTLMTAEGAPQAADSGAPAAGTIPTGQPPVEPGTPTAPTDAPSNAVPDSGKPAEPGADSGKPEDQKASDKPAQQAPEKYELKLPDGAHLDASALERTAAWARERGLSNEQAQAVLEFANDQAQAWLQSQRAEVQRLAFEEWPTQLQADPEYGGARFNETAEFARRGFAKFGTPALKQALQETGYGNHPELVKTFARIGRELAEDQIEGGGKGGASSRSKADILFGDS